MGNCGTCKFWRDIQLNTPADASLLKECGLLAPYDNDNNYEKAFMTDTSSYFLTEADFGCVGYAPKES